MTKTTEPIVAKDVTEEVKQSVQPSKAPTRINVVPVIHVPSEIDVLADPQRIIDNAIKVSKILKDVVDNSKKKSIIVVNNNEYLMFSAWQTIAQFYGFTAQTEWTKKLIDNNGRFQGYQAKAVLVNLRSGQTHPGAEAVCHTVEQNWNGKPEFTLMSMAQTRACSKTLANKFRWVAVLAGYEGTPGEEMSAELFARPSQTVAVDGTVEEQDPPPSVRQSGGATVNQLKFVRKNFLWKKLNVATFEAAYKPIGELTFDDAKIMLDYLFKEKKPTMEALFKLFGIKESAPEPSTEPDPTDSWGASGVNEKLV